MKINKILWPTDFSNNAEQAVPYVQSLTQQYGAEIHVLYVIEDIAHHESWYGEFKDNHIKELMEWANKSATKRLNQVCDKYLDGCPLYIKHIDKEEVELVVMTTHGQKGTFPFGSVTEKVLKNSPVPVTTIPIVPDTAA